MPNYKYAAYDRAGKESSGRIFAKDPADAASILKEKGLYLRDIGEDRAGGFRLEKGPGLADVFSNLSAMISSGVLVPDAVRSIGMEAQGAMKSALSDVHENLIRGVSLSGAMEQRKDMFPAYIASMVRAGEESGTLDTVLANLSDFLEKERELRDRVRSALIYPAFMVGVSFILIFFVLLFVFPRITSIFAEQKVPLPVITRIFLSVSAIVYGYWYLVAAAIAGGCWGVVRWYRKNRYAVGRWMFNAPFRAIRNLEIARVSRVLGLLLGGGVSVLKALEYARGASGNPYLADELDRVKSDVREGKKFSDAATFLPPTHMQIVTTGERTGNLTGALGKVASMAEREFNKAVDNFLKILEPSIILGMGIIVGVMVIAILLPIFQMNQMIK